MKQIFHSATPNTNAPPDPLAASMVSAGGWATAASPLATPFVISGKIVSSGRTFIVQQQTATNTTVLSGGILVVEAGTELGGTIQSGGEVLADRKSIVSGMAVAAGGQLIDIQGSLVEGGGAAIAGELVVGGEAVASAVTIASGGIAIVSAGGTLTDATFDRGATLVVLQGGVTSDVHERPGATVVRAGVLVQNQDGTVVIVQSGSLSGGTIGAGQTGLVFGHGVHADALTVTAGGVLDVLNGAAVRDIVLSSPAVSTGSATTAAVLSLGTGARAHAITLSGAGAILSASSNTTIDHLHLDAGASATVDGMADGLTIGRSATVGGVGAVADVTVGSMGGLNDGGAVTDLVVRHGGSAELTGSLVGASVFGVLRLSVMDVDGVVVQSGGFVNDFDGQAVRGGTGIVVSAGGQVFTSDSPPRPAAVDLLAGATGYANPGSGKSVGSNVTVQSGATLHAFVGADTAGVMNDGGTIDTITWAFFKGAAGQFVSQGYGTAAGLVITSADSLVVSSGTTLQHARIEGEVWAVSGVVLRDCDIRSGADIVPLGGTISGGTIQAGETVAGDNGLQVSGTVLSGELYDVATSNVLVASGGVQYNNHDGAIAQNTTIAAGGTVDLNGNNEQAVGTVVQSGGLLSLDPDDLSHTFSEPALLTNLQAGGTIALLTDAGESKLAFNSATDTLSLSSNGHTYTSLTLAGDYSGMQFNLTQDPHTISKLITLSVASRTVAGGVATDLLHTTAPASSAAEPQLGAAGLAGNHEPTIALPFHPTLLSHLA